MLTKTEPSTELVGLAGASSSSRTLPRPLCRALPFLVFCVMAGMAHAQVNISGDIWDGNGGPLLTGTVYHATSEVRVPVGQTLTVQAGAIVKFHLGNQELITYGTLNVNGTAANPAVFTSILDDDFDGDTDGDGASTGVPGNWRGLNFDAGSTGCVEPKHFS